MVVDLTVNDDGEGAVLVEDRLLAAREIDDAQVAHAKSDRPVDQDTLVVRVTMDDLRQRFLQEEMVKTVEPNDAAHGVRRNLSGTDRAHTAMPIIRPGM
jgi:hypothetical protein